MTAILDLLKRRASVRFFIDKEVPPDVIHEILEAGRLSPSGGNEQPWRFGFITEKSLISQIAELAGQPWIASAPIVIVLCVVPVSYGRGGRDIQVDRFPQYKDQIMALESDLYHALNMEEHQTKIPGTHMPLTALEQGLGGCWVSRFDVRKLAELLDLPAAIFPAELLVLGYPKTGIIPKDKKPLSEIAFFNLWK